MSPPRSAGALLWVETRVPLSTAHSPAMCCRHCSNSVRYCCLRAASFLRTAARRALTYFSSTLNRRWCMRMLLWYTGASSTTVYITCNIARGEIVSYKSLLDGWHGPTYNCSPWMEDDGRCCSSVLSHMRCSAAEMYQHYVSSDNNEQKGRCYFLCQAAQTKSVCIPQ